MSRVELIGTDRLTTEVEAAIDALIAGAPGALNTLKELADAVNDDASFAATVVTALAGKQPLDPDLTAIAALDSATPGVIASDGSGWFRKAFSGLKTSLGLVKADVALGNVDNTSDLAKPVSDATASAIEAEATLRTAADLLLIPLTQKGTANGVATLGPDGTVPSNQVPPLAIGDTFTVASEAAMLALDAQRGDVAVRTDLDPDGMFILIADDPTILANWQQITAPGAVLSVNGQAGAVVLVKGDVGLGNVDNTSDANKPISDATAAALADKQPLDADLTEIAGLGPTNDDLMQRKAGAWTNRTPAQVKADLNLAKGDVALGNVDNTSDVNKPVSDATQEALDGKQDVTDAVVAATLAALDAAHSYFSHQSGLWASGFMNCVAMHPTKSGVLIGGSDLGGPIYSQDGGRHWKQSRLIDANREDDTRIGSAYWDANGYAYLLSGTAAISKSKIWRSTDDGKTYSKLYENTVFDVTSGGTQPRAVGRNIFVDTVRNLLYLGTSSKGVVRCDLSNLATPPVVIALAGQKISSLVADPADSTVLFATTVADATASVYKITVANGAAVATGVLPIATASVAHDLFFVGTTLWVAAGATGVYSAASPYTAFTSRIGDLPVAGPVYSAIVGKIATNGKSVVFVGCSAPNGAGLDRKAVLRTDDGLVAAPVWVSKTSDATKKFALLGGPDGPAWPFVGFVSSNAGTDNQNRMAGSNFVVSQLELRGNEVVESGRSGIYRSPDLGENWYPAVRGIGATTNRHVITDPLIPGRVLLANVDWTSILSADYGRTVVQARTGFTFGVGPGGGNSPMTFAHAIDSASRVYGTIGQRDLNEDGEIYYHADPALGTAWTSTGFRAALVAGGESHKRAVGIAVQVRSNGDRVVLAAVDGSGIWRGVQVGGAGVFTWTKVNTVAMATVYGEPSATTQMLWRGDVAFCYDRHTGIWRSTDAGVTWALFWDATNVTYPLGVPNDPWLYIGYMASPTAGELWVAGTNDILYRIATGAETAGLTVGAGIVPVIVALPGARKPGPLASDAAGRLLVATRPENSKPVGIYRTGDLGTTWTKVSDEDYERMGTTPTYMAVSSDGVIYVATNGSGLVVLEPVGLLPDWEDPQASPVTAVGGSLLSGRAIRDFVAGTGIVIAGTDDGGASKLAISIDDLSATYQPLRIQFKEKTADELVNTSAVLQDDDHLFLSVEAGKRYLVELFLKVQGASVNADLKIGFAALAGMTYEIIRGSAEGPSTGTSAAALSTTTTSSGLDANTSLQRYDGFITTTTDAGILQLQWAQAVSTAEDVKLKTGSLMRLTKIN